MEFGQRPDQKRRVLNIGFVVLLHAILLYALVVGLSRKAVEVLPPPIETKIVEEEHHEEPPPPPPPPPMMTPPPAAFVPLPEIRVAQPPPQNAIAAVSPEPTPVTTVPPVPAPQHVPPVINAKRNCPEPEYPSLSLRLGEKGTVTLQFLIDIKGRVKESKVKDSSGHPRLDEAARSALSRCRFTPGTLNGVEEESWAELKYTWRIPN